MVQIGQKITMHKKLINLSQLEKRTNFLKKKGKKIVLCHGVFDLLHVGHIKHLKKAKEYGDKLVVTLTSDRYVNKGPGRPYNRLEHRLLVLMCIFFLV